MALRLATIPAIRNTVQLKLRQQPIGLVKIHSSTARLNSTITEKAEKKPDRGSGSQLWNQERIVSLSLVPLISSQLVFGASPFLDAFLSGAIAIHIFHGFRACITDYFNPEKRPYLNLLAGSTVFIGNIGVAVACYQFNTKDIGLTEFLCRLWAQ
ncbi:CybS-domain-containing protein [Pilaira anomala]|nr:CybS-domain-containing protein [Pilaira anomala]